MAKQLSFEKISGWGGRRRGAGRPNKSGQVGHAKREVVDFKKPLHITLRLKDKMPRLRTKAFLKEFKAAVRVAHSFDLRVVHYSILGNHIHLLIEARNNLALERGMKSLCGRLGKLLRALVGGVGSVWAGRFHLHVLKTPTEVHRALKYVLLNYSEHGNLLEHLDDFSSGHHFKDWARLLGRRLNGLMEEQLRSRVSEENVLSSAYSWLLRTGWTRARATSYPLA